MNEVERIENMLEIADDLLDKVDLNNAQLDVVNEYANIATIALAVIKKIKST